MKYKEEIPEKGFPLFYAVMYIKRACLVIKSEKAKKSKNTKP